MKPLLRMILILSIAPFAAATAYDAPRELSPVQQYLYQESGYAPRYETPLQQAPEPVEPYDTADAADEAANGRYDYYGHHINQGVAGMNLY